MSQNRITVHLLEQAKDRLAPDYLQAAGYDEDCTDWWVDSLHGISDTVLPEYVAGAMEMGVPPSRAYQIALAALMGALVEAGFALGLMIGREEAADES